MERAFLGRLQSRQPPRRECRRSQRQRRRKSSAGGSAQKLAATMRRWGRAQWVARTASHNGGLTPVDMIAAVLRCNLRLLVREFALLHKEFCCGFVSVAAFNLGHFARSAQTPARLLYWPAFW